MERRGNRVTSHDAVFTFLFSFLSAETILQAEQLLTPDLLSHLHLQVLGLGFISLIIHPAVRLGPGLVQNIP